MRIFLNDFFYCITQAEIIDPALKGTLNVLRSCAKASSIKRVVVTSSMAAVAFSAKPLTSGVVVDETWYSDPEFCEKSKVPVSKFPDNIAVHFFHL